jgi:hypothetical protein
MSPNDYMKVINSHAQDPQTGWSVGTFGAIAEFVRDADEPAKLHRTPDAVSVVTDRGALRIEAVGGLRLFASETPTKESWSQRVALCLPTAASAMHQRATVTELGPDAGALRERDRAAILFDLGLAAPQIDACVRVVDPAIAAELRKACGRSIFDSDSPAMGILLAASPARVFVSKVGRIEVDQPIPPPDGKSPEGPHTHLLPRLLRSGQTHAATEPIPPGWVPCAHFYPAHPARDMMGAPRDYKTASHDAFQALLRLYGDPELIELKERLLDAVATRQSPAAFVVPNGRFARATVRIALRQLEASGIANVAAWQNHHDASRADAEGVDAEN